MRQHYVDPVCGEEAQVHGVCGTTDLPQELRSPKGQAFLWNRQVS